MEDMAGPIITAINISFTFLRNISHKKVITVTYDVGYALSKEAGVRLRK